MPPALTLPIPADKNAPPKVLVLDFNMWIELSKSHHVRPDAKPEAKLALDAIRKAKAGGRLVVPIAFMNAIEVARVTPDDRRQRLARFMVDLSSNLALASVDAICPAEKRSALARVYLQREAEPVRPMLVGRGLRAFFQGAAARVDVLSASPAASVAFLVDGMRASGAVERDREREVAAAERIQESRDEDADMSERDRRKINLANLWTHPSTEPFRDAVRAAAGDTAVEAFKVWLGEGDNLFALWDEVPTSHVSSVLEGRASTNPEKPIHVNDLRDVPLYQVALPYANILATEKHWATVIDHMKLDKKYGTRLVRKLAALPDALRAEGCL